MQWQFPLFLFNPAGEKPFQCNVCGKRFSRQSTLNTHEKVHTGDQIFKCEICGRVFDVYRHLTEHMAVHRIDKPFTCKICNKSYSRATVLSQHMKLHTDETIYKCQVCGKGFPNALQQKEHEMEHAVEDDDDLMTLYKCYACTDTFKTSRECTNHMQIHTQQPVIVENHSHHLAQYRSVVNIQQQQTVQVVMSFTSAPITKAPTLTPVIKPTLTTLMTPALPSLITTTIASINKPVIATPIVALPPPSLPAHEMPAVAGSQLRSSAIVTTNGSRIIQAPPVAPILPPPALPAHVPPVHIVHTTIDECGSDEDMDDIEEDETLFYTCDVCNQTFKLEADLRAHHRTHTISYEKYKCDVCEKRFSLLSNFNVHKRIHKREKPFRCDICGKCFRLAKSLTVHMILHTENESFNCEICQRSFNRPTALKLHMKTHSRLEQLRAYSMCYNDEYDDDDDELMEGEYGYDTMVDERPTYCDICGQRFNRCNGNIRTHKCTKGFTIEAEEVEDIVEHVSLPCVAM